MEAKAEQLRQEAKAEKAELRQEMQHRVWNSVTPGTLRSYVSGMRAWYSFCESIGHRLLPSRSETVGLFALIFRNSGTCTQCLATIRIFLSKDLQVSPRGGAWGRG